MHDKILQFYEDNSALASLWWWKKVFRSVPYWSYIVKVCILRTSSKMTLILCCMSQTLTTKLLRRANWYLQILCSYIEKFPSAGNLWFDDTYPAQINLLLVFSLENLSQRQLGRVFFSLFSFFIVLKFLSLSEKKKLICRVGHLYVASFGFTFV